MDEKENLILPDMTPLLSWYEANKRDLPWRHTRDPYRIWVSEIMLQQTRVEAVIPYYERFLSRLPTVQALAECPEDELMKLWEGLGYYSRVRNMQKAARSIVELHNGVFPNTYAEIRALCGIGDYTAGAIGAFAFDLPVPAVDGNVLRVVARLCAYEEDVLSPVAKRTVTAAVAAAQPPERAADFNQALIELGAIVCTPNGVSKCEECPLKDACLARAKGLETTLPVRKKAAPRKITPKTVLILRDGERVALCRRPDTGLLAGLFEPPTLAGHWGETELRELLLKSGIAPLYLTPLENAKHIFTHLEWHMVGFEIVLREEDVPQIGNIPLDGAENGVFFAPREEIDESYAIPGAYRAYRPYM